MFRASVARTAQCALIALQIWHSQLYRPPLSLCLSRWVTAPPARQHWPQTLPIFRVKRLAGMSWCLDTFQQHSYLLLTMGRTSERNPICLSLFTFPGTVYLDILYRVWIRRWEAVMSRGARQVIVLSQLFLYIESSQYKDIVLAKNVNCWRLFVDSCKSHV